MPTETIPERRDISAQEQWNLRPLVPSDRTWEALFQEIEDQLDNYETYKGRLGESAAVLKQALDFHLSVSRKLDRLYTYAHLKSDEDQSNQFYMGLYQKAIALYTRASELSSFITPEIQSIPDKVITGFSEKADLKEYAFHLEKILRYKPHTLSEPQEEILAMTREMAQAPSQIFSQLDNVDLKFGSVKDHDGRLIELSHGNFNTFLQSPLQRVRKAAFFRYYRAYENHKHTLASALAHSVKKDVFYAKVRKFTNARSGALFVDDVPETVYDNLIHTVKRNLTPLFRYLDFRKKALGLRKLHFYDTYVPIVADMNFHMPYEQAVEVCLSALRPLGEDYSRRLKEGLLGGWVDRYENRGKRSGAYSSGCFDSAPYILLNYDERNISSLYTLIHEAGHSMHSYYSRKHQPYVDHEYTIFVAEVASTLNENLLGRHLFKLYKDDKPMKAYVLNREIDNIRATLFRQTMFAEFEKIIHAIVESRQPLTLEIITGQYQELLQHYFGDCLSIDAELALECLRIPHFYSAFYVYKYATGISAAIALAENIAREAESARNAYLNFLKLGGSKFPLDELRLAGVDMQSAEPVQQAIDHFGALVDRLITLYREL